MANRDALRKLSRKFPAPPEIETIMDGLRDQNDISTAIVASAIAEASLERLITERFKSKSKSLIGQIFLNRGPLSDFHGKILLAEAFGLITRNMAEELHSIKAIRNAFAHAKIPIDFDNEIIAREIASLRMMPAMRAVDSDKREKFKMTNKACFLLTTRILLIIFDGIEKHSGTADEALRDALGDGKPKPSS
jgi:DNA-binding MltR family transcriptional regulator